MSSAGNNFYLQFFQSVLLPAGWTAPPQHIGEGTPAERLDLGCYSAHIFSRSVVIYGTILRRRTPSNVVIRDTIFPLPDWSSAHSLPPRCCYPAHNFIRPFPSGFPRQSCYPAHILQLCSALPGVVIQHTFYT